MRDHGKMRESEMEDGRFIDENEIDQARKCNRSNYETRGDDQTSDYFSETHSFPSHFLSSTLVIYSNKETCDRGRKKGRNGAIIE